MKKRIDVAALTAVVGTLYPEPFDLPCRARERTKLGDPAGLTQFGVNLCRLPPGAWSSQRHWHTGGDEFVYVLSGEVVLVTDGGEEVLARRGQCRLSGARHERPLLPEPLGPRRGDPRGRDPRSPATRPITRTSTWSHRREANPPSIPTGTEHPTRTSGGAGLDRVAPLR